MIRLGFLLQLGQMGIMAVANELPGVAVPHQHLADVHAVHGDMRHRAAVLVGVDLVDRDGLVGDEIRQGVPSLLAPRLQFAGVSEHPSIHPEFADAGRIGMVPKSNNGAGFGRMDGSLPLAPCR